MPAVVDPKTIHVDKLPGVWSPVQWELTEAERAAELQAQAQASLLWAVDVPEALLRLLLGESAVERTFEPPAGYDPEAQGEWDDSLVTFQFKRPIRLVKLERESNYLYVEYDLEGLGRWALEIEPEEIGIFRV